MSPIDTTPTVAAARPSLLPGKSLRRWALAGLGVIFTGVGAVGAVVPGLPTTIFVILASYCFARSCPWLEERLLRNRVFARSMRYIDGDAMMSNQQRATIACIILASSSLSIGLLATTGRLSWLIAAIIAGLAVLGVLTVFAWRRGLRRTSGLG